MRELLAGLVPGLPAAADPGHRRPRRRDPAVRRRDRPDAPRRGPAGARGRRLPPGRRPDQPRRPRDAHRAHRQSRLDGLAPDDRALVSDAAVLGQSFTLAGLAAVSGDRRGRPRAAPALARPPRAPDPRDGPAQPRARPVRLRPGAHPRGRLQHARASATARRATSPPPASSRASAPTSSPGRSPATTWPPTRTPPRGPRRTPSPARRGSPFRAAAERAVGLGSHDQALTFLEQALAVTTDPADAGRAAVSGPALPPRRPAATSWPRRPPSGERSLRSASWATARRRAAAIAALAEALLSGRRTAEALALLEPAADEFADLRRGSRRRRAAAASWRARTS